MDLASEQVPITLAHVHRFTLEEYHRLIESGGFDEDMRVELIEGLVVDMSPKSREHEQAVEWLNRWLVIACERTGLRVRPGSALTFDRSEPEPDFALVRSSAPAPYHPATAALVVEIAVSSLRYDLVTKSVVYARARIPEYWVVDVDGRRVVCHRHPRADGSYRDVIEVAHGGRLVAASVELPPLDVGELMAAAYA